MANGEQAQPAQAEGPDEGAGEGLEQPLRGPADRAKAEPPRKDPGEAPAAATESGGSPPDKGGIVP